MLCNAMCSATYLQQFGENCCLHILLWNLRQLFSSKHLSASSRWHDAICSKMVILTITSVGTSDLMMNVYSVKCQLYVMCIVKIWSYHCALLVELIFACGQYVHGSMKDKTLLFHAVNTPRMDMKTPSSLESWQFLNKNFSFEFFLVGVNHGCNLEVISIACFNM